jgi:hypothetical protein
MSDDQKPHPLEDIRQGLGLFLRAAKTTLEKLPTRDVERVVVTGAREVGRAIESVGKAIERDLIKVTRDETPAPPGAAAAAPADPPAAEAAKAEAGAAPKAEADKTAPPADGNPPPG